MERAAEKRMPKRIVVADAATTPEQKPQTVELPSAKMVQLVPKEVVPVTAAPPAPKTTRSDSLPCVIQVKPITAQSMSLRFIGSHPVI